MLLRLRTSPSLPPFLSRSSPPWQAQNAGAAVWAYPDGAGPSLASQATVSRLSTYVSSAVLTPEACPVANANVTGPTLVNTPSIITDPALLAVPHKLRLSFYGSVSDQAVFKTWVATLSGATPSAFASIGAALSGVSATTDLGPASLSTPTDDQTSAPLSAYIFAAAGVSATQLANYGVNGGFDIQPTWGPPGTAAILSSGLLSTGGPQNTPGGTVPAPPPTPTVHSAGVNVAGAVGGAIGGFAGLAACMALAWWVTRGRVGGSGGGGGLDLKHVSSPNPMAASSV